MKDKKILVLIGKGKSTLINFFLENSGLILHDNIKFFDGLPKKQKDIMKIKEFIYKKKGNRFIITMDNDLQYKELEPSIKRRAMKFNLFF